MTSTPVALNCGLSCSADFANAASVTLTAAAASASIFAGWSGEGCTGTCALSMTQARNVTALFNPDAKAVITSPTPASTLPGSAVTFTWSPGTGVSQYHLYVGTSSGGQQIYSQNRGSNLSAAVSSIPANDSTIHVRLRHWSSSRWQPHPRKTLVPDRWSLAL